MSTPRTGLRRILWRPLAALVLLLAAGCGTSGSAADWVASPVLQFADEADGEDCRDHPPRAAPLAGGRCARIGTWNMHYLGPSEETPEETRDPARLAEYVRRGGASVLAMQEIGATDTPEGPRNATLDAIFRRLDETTGADWTYVLFGAEDRDQFVGLAWDRRVWSQVGDARPLDVEGDAPGLFGFIPLPIVTKLWPRPPHAVKLSAGPGLTDVVFVPVHLLSRVELWFFEDATAHRTAEATALAEALLVVRDELRDRDVVVPGDFNIEFATDHFTDALLEHGWRDLNCANLGTHHLDMPLDRIFVPDDQPEFGLVRNFARVVPPEATSWMDFVSRWSDHQMVVADVLIGPDDD
jgi:endonuclease/exonuclease/phosphatase family metal-dependent hydrolase